MQKLKLYLHYHRRLLAFNLPFSLLVSVVSMAISAKGMIGLINGFSLSLLTGSFVLSVYFYGQRYGQQYYFYHNMGISKQELIVSAFLLNAMLAVLLFCFKLCLYA
ncbi:hypothetical protein [Pontibacter burrus]|uniref:ABC transporter permease n=1 Tax=Pontibacter burrus TaxID=2704466 RepID=A0A6B3LUN2_9BACT|nr:hypothetical protein [Pontibacter burrus]NEM99523.1 hypothetical protein [Pontibacter burrus]